MMLRPRVWRADGPGEPGQLGLVPGQVVAEEIEHEGGRWIYSFEIRPTGETRKLIREVNLDADTGALVGGIDTERD